MMHQDVTDLQELTTLLLPSFGAFANEAYNSVYSTNETSFGCAAVVSDSSMECLVLARY